MLEDLHENVWTESKNDFILEGKYDIHELKQLLKGRDIERSREPQQVLEELVHRACGSEKGQRSVLLPGSCVDSPNSTGMPESGGFHQKIQLPHVLDNSTSMSNVLAPWLRIFRPLTLRRVTGWDI